MAADEHVPFVLHLCLPGSDAARGFSGRVSLVQTHRTAHEATQQAGGKHAQPPGLSREHTGTCGRPARLLGRERVRAPPGPVGTQHTTWGHPLVDPMCTTAF